MNIDFYKNNIEPYIFDPTVGKAVSLLFGIVVIYLLVRFIQGSINRHVTGTDARYRVKKATHFFGYLLVFGLLGILFSDRLGQLTVAFGVAGAGIAFALQEVIASVAGWVAISFGGFYKPGDRVQVGGIQGDVIDIGVLRTTVMEIGQWVNGDLYDGRIVRVANSFVFKSPVFNYSADFPFLWDEITFPVRYGSDWKYAKEEFRRIAEEIVGKFTSNSKIAWKNVVNKYRVENANIDPTVTITANENWITFTIRYIVDYKQRRTTKDIFFEKILESVESSNKRIIIGSAGFELLSAPSLNVQFKQINNKSTSN